MPDNQRTVDDVIAEWRAYLAGIAYLQREAGPPNPDREPTDRELILAEITRLRAEVAQQAADIQHMAIPSICLTPGAIYNVHADHQGHVFLCVTLPRSIDHDLIKNYTSGRFAVADGDNSYAALRTTQEKMRAESRRISKLFHDALEPLIGNIYRTVWPLGIAGRTIDGEIMPPTYDEYLTGGVGDKLVHLLKNAPRDGTYIEVSIGAAVIHNVYWCDEASEWAQGGRTFYPKLPETATWQYMTKPVVKGSGSHREEINNAPE